MFGFLENRQFSMYMSISIHRLNNLMEDIKIKKMEINESQKKIIEATVSLTPADRNKQLQANGKV